ncbi:MAG: hemolysin family protein [Dehalococcoidales bacterium]|nr:hemolysin family protein [Dehalococcoidales bacterium]
MTSEILTEIGVIALLILVNAFFAGSEIAVVSVPRARIRQLAEDGVRSAQIIMRLMENASRFLATIQVGVTLAGFFASAVAAISLATLLGNYLRTVPFAPIASAADPIAVIVVTFLVSYFTLVFGELAPKTIAIRYAEAISLRIARPIDILATITMPIVGLLTISTNLVLRLFGVRERARMPAVSEDEIISMVDAGEHDGIIQPFERNMIHGIFDFGDLVVREVMVPRIDMLALEKDTPVEEAVGSFMRAGFSRLPIYEGSIDNVVGILDARDLLRYFSQTPRPSGITALMRPPVFVPETKRVSELFRELQQNRTQMAVVVDEYGGTAGLVTMEDLLEEIVGEIRDEYDLEESRLDVVGPHEVLANGLVSVADLGEALDVEIEVEDVDTVAGLVFAKLGRIPIPGDSVQAGDVTVTVESMVGRRIRKVRAIRSVPPEEEEE